MIKEKDRTRDFVLAYGHQTWDSLNEFINDRMFTNVFKYIGSAGIILMWDSIYVDYTVEYIRNSNSKFAVIRQFGRNIELPNLPEYEAYKRDCKIQDILSS